MIKEGTWVFSPRSRKIWQWNDSDQAYMDKHGFNFSQVKTLVEEWIPKKGDWCIFYNRGYDGFKVSRYFEKFNVNDWHKTSNGDYFEFCEPYTGYMPEHIKE